MRSNPISVFEATHQRMRGDRAALSLTVETLFDRYTKEGRHLPDGSRKTEGYLEHVRQTGRPEPQTRIAGVPATERDLRTGAEQAYRQLASLTPDRLERVRLVDAANAVRPRSLV